MYVVDSVANVIGNSRGIISEASIFYPEHLKIIT